MPDPLAIPDRADAVTPDWLSAALSPTFPGIEVSRVDILDQHSGTTGRLRVGVDYAAGPAGPATLFVKLPPFDESQRRFVAMTDMGRREARFYQGPALEVPLRIPRPYYAAHGDEPTEYIMVLEDLQATNCLLTTRLDPHAEEHAEPLIEDLARLHAHFWEDPRFDQELSWIRPPMRGAFGAQLIERAGQKFAAEQAPVFGELCALYAAEHERICEVWDEGERTLVHGDTHAGNQFGDGARVGLYDWAVVSRAPGIRDVSIYLGNSCPTPLRRSEEERWLRRYRDVLVENGVNPPAFEVLWDRYRRGVLYAWVAATTTASMGSRWQPVEVGMTGMARATAACADLGTIDAFHDAF